MPLPRNQDALAQEKLVELFSSPTPLSIGVFPARPPLPRAAVSHMVKAYQPLFPFAEQVKKMGYQLSHEWLPDSLDHALVLVTRSKKESLALLARATLAVKSGGTVTLFADLQLGAKSYRGVCQELFGAEAVQAGPKNHAWIITGTKGSTLNQEYFLELRKLLEPQKVEKTSYEADVGLFSYDHIDPASALLVNTLAEEKDLSGSLADLGCGWGYLTGEIVQQAPGISSAALFDWDERAVLQAAANVRRINPKLPIEQYWCDLTLFQKAEQYDVVVVNPPHHNDAGLDYTRGEVIVETAKKLTRAGGKLYVVAQVTRPYEKLLPGGIEIKRHRGFKVLRA